TRDCQAFRGVLGTKVVVLKPGEPEHNGIIERAHDYFERSFLPGRTFSGPGDFNHQFGKWLQIDAGLLRFGAIRELPFGAESIGMHPKTIKHRHTNSVRFAVHTDPAAAGYTPRELAAATPTHEAAYYSIGGGFIERHGQAAGTASKPLVPLPFSTGADLLAICEREQLSISDVMWRNEIARRRP